MDSHGNEPLNYEKIARAKQIAEQVNILIFSHFLQLKKLGNKGKKSISVRWGPSISPSS